MERFRSVFAKLRHHLRSFPVRRALRFAPVLLGVGLLAWMVLFPVGSRLWAERQASRVSCTPEDSFRADRPRLAVEEQTGQVIQFSDDGRYLLTHHNGGIGVWEVESGTLAGWLRPPLPEGRITLSPDGRRLAVGRHIYQTSSSGLRCRFASARVVGFLDGDRVLTIAFAGPPPLGEFLKIRESIPEDERPSLALWLLYWPLTSLIEDPSWREVALWNGAGERLRTVRRGWIATPRLLDEGWIASQAYWPRHELWNLEGSDVIPLGDLDWPSATIARLGESGLVGLTSSGTLYRWSDPGDLPPEVESLDVAGFRRAPAIALSRDGRYAAVANPAGRTIDLYSVESGEKLGGVASEDVHRVRPAGSSSWMPRMAFSPDGEGLAVSGEGTGVRLLAVPSLDSVGSFGDVLPLSSWTISPGGRHLAVVERAARTGIRAGTPREMPRLHLLDLRSGNRWSAFPAPPDSGRSGRPSSWRPPELDWSRDGDTLRVRAVEVVEGADGSPGEIVWLSRWDTRSGAPIGEHLRVPVPQEGAFTASPDLRAGVLVYRDEGRRCAVLTRGEEHEAATTPLFCGPFPIPASFSPDGRFVATSPASLIRVGVYDVANGERVHRSRIHAGMYEHALTFSPDGRRIAYLEREGSEPLHRVVLETLGSDDPPLVLSEGVEFTGDPIFSPDGSSVLLPLRTDDHDRVALHDASNGSRLWEVPGAIPAEGERSIRFARDGGRVAILLRAGLNLDTRVRYDEELAVEVDVQSGEILSTQALPEESTLFYRGDRLLAQVGDEIHDARRGERLVRYVAWEDGRWAALDPEGRYDGSDGGDVHGLHWMVGLEPIALHQLKERYYEPGLLAKVMGFNDEPLRDVQAFQSVDLYPEIRVTRRPSATDPRIGVTLLNRGGGIGRVVVSLNGRELTPDARPEGFDPASDSLTLTLNVSGSRFLLPGDSNRVEVRALDAEGYLSSRARGLEVAASGSGDGAAEAADPQLWAVVAGVSDYVGEAIDLRYAAKDASDFAGALELAGGRLFGEARTHVTLLSSEDVASGAPRRERLIAALEALTDSAAVTDVVVVYLAGHGVVHGGAEGDYFYLTSEARSAALTDPAIRSTAALSSAELSELLMAIPALKQVLILDTCGAGRAVETLSAARDVPSSQVRAIQRMKDRTGMYVLAGSAADAVSYEASRYAQGVLTYSLLMGLRGAALRDNEFVDVGTLFNFAVDEVPRLAGEIGGIQRPELATPRGGQSFDIGRLTSTDRSRIPLAEARPLVLRVNFQDERRFVDHLGLTLVVNDALREASARARGDGSLVFVDAESFPGAYSVVGRYTVTGGDVRVRGLLFRGDEEAGSFSVRGAVEDLEALAERIRGEAEQLIRVDGRG